MRVTEAVWVDVREAVQLETDRPRSTSDWPRVTERRRFPWQRARRIAQVGHAGHPRRDDLWFGYAEPGLLDAAWYGPAEIELPDGERITVQAQLTGAMQPTDGQYHWQGHIAAADGLKPGTKIVVHAGGTPAPGRVSELTPWGSLHITGAGQPPFPLDDLEVDIPAV
nr:DUF4873 domain-containing protein [Flexivirga aerilata]